MSTHKSIDRICAVAAALALLLTILLLNGEALGLKPASKAMGYEDTLFDTSRVHTIDIVMDGWEEFLDGCEDEQYAPCAVVIDGEAYKNVGLRAKGNTSLSSVSELGSGRYSFKIEFDHYDAGKTCQGLDKLCLNNLIQDNTMMKDYLTYRMMAAFGVNAPLCSYAFLTVNGEDWGLYLAVEGVEDAFLRRNFGKNGGELYKPDSAGLGGGPGNGKDFRFDEEEFGTGDGDGPSAPPGADGGRFEAPDGQGGNRGGRPGGRPDGPFTPPEGQTPPGGQNGGGPNDVTPPGGQGGHGGMGSDSVKLKYAGDDPDSYTEIFDSAKTDPTSTDKSRLIAALKALGEGDAEGALDVEQTLRYFVVHNFVVNGDSYTGSMVHNYYLYEQDGRLSMLPWDYNLAFGTFGGGDATEAVNDPIDSPLSVSGDGDRPMIDWIFQSGEYTALYHQYFEEFLSAIDPAVFIDGTYELIAPYVERDPTKFCTCEEFETGVAALQTFCALRAQSVSGQLSGHIPSTGGGQAADGSALVDASSLVLSDLGTMGLDGGPGGGKGFRPPDTRD